MRELADAIPELGHGGREVANLLIELASRVETGVIVDIGPYLGSTTAYLALGAPRGTPIHVFDTWDADICDLRAKAKHFHGMELPKDLLPLFLANMKPFNANLVIHRCDIGSPQWDGTPIGLFVDDIGVDAERTEAKMSVFGPHFIQGSKLLLLDYFWFKKKQGEEFKGAHAYMQRHTHWYEFIQKAGEVGALFEVVR